MAEFPEIIKDGDIELRLIQATFDNAYALYDLIKANREYLGEFLRWVAKVNSPEDQYKWIESSAKEKRDYFIYTDGRLSGTIGLVKYCQEENKRWAEIGYWIDSSVSGRGIMTRAVKMLEDFIFKTGEINRIQILMDDLNIASSRVAEKAGYKYEGTLRAFDKVGTKGSGDIRSYSKLKSEWQGENKNA